MSKTGQVAMLLYNAADEKLTGQIGSFRINETAYSGGSRGHKTNKVSAKQARNYRHADPLNDSLGRLATTREDYDKKADVYARRGGTIPPGHYLCVFIAQHASFGPCIRLDQTRDALFISSPFARIPIVHGRGGFFIHGHGPKGSDGCIVPASNQRRVQLNHAVANFSGEVYLNVVHVSYMLPAELDPTPDQIQV